MPTETYEHHASRESTLDDIEKILNGKITASQCGDMTITAWSDGRVEVTKGWLKRIAELLRN